MPDMRRFLDLTGLGIYDAKIKQVISTGDAQALADAKKYFDDNKSLFEAAGAVKTAQEALQAAINAVDAKVNGILDGESIDSFKDVETELAKYQLSGDYATKAEAQGYADAKDEAIAAAKKSGDDAQANLDAYKVVVGETYESKVDAAAKLTEAKGYTDAEIAKVDAKVAENVGDIEELAGKVAALEAGTYDDTEVRGLIKSNADAIGAVEDDVEVIKGDYLKSSDKTEVVNAINAEKERAEGVEGGLRTDVDAIKVDYLTSTDKTELQGNIDVVAGKVTTLIGEDANKSVRTIANEELAKQLIADNAAESLDTLTEIAAWIQSHPEDASAMNKAIEDLEALVGTLPQGITATNVVDYIAEVKDAIQVEIDSVVEDIDGLQLADEGIIERLTFVEDTLGLGAPVAPTAVPTSGYVDKVYVNTNLSTEEVCNIIDSCCSSSDNGDYIYAVDEDNYLRISNYHGSYSISLNGSIIFNYSGWQNNFTNPIVVNSEVLNPEDINSGSFAYNYLGRYNDQLTNLFSITPFESSMNVYTKDEVDVLINKVELTLDTLEGVVDGKAEAQDLTDAVSALEDVDAGLAERIEVLEAKHGDGEGTIESLIADAKAEAIAEAKVDAANKDAVVLAESQRYVDAAIDEVEASIDTLQGVVDGKAAQSDVTTLAGRVTTAEGEIDTLQSEMDAVEAVAAAAAKASDLTALTTRVGTAEGEIDTLQSEMDAVEGRLDDAEAAIEDKADASVVDALATRVGTAETNISANAAALAKFTEITEAEINALFVQ